MSSDGVDLKRRRVLTAITTGIGAVGAVFVAVPFLSSMQPSARARAAGAPVEVDIDKIEPGGMIRVEWRGKPVWIVRRTEEALASLAKVESSLADADSAKSIQPDNATNKHRSIKEEYFVAVGICTHLGCSPTFKPEPGGDMGADWLGGFFCPCHGSTFDLAGRVYAGVPAPTNLEVPPYAFLTDSRLIIGEAAGGVA